MFDDLAGGVSDGGGGGALGKEGCGEGDCLTFDIKGGR